MMMWPQGTDITGKASEMHVEAALGDITTEQVDAIVNAANEHLLPGGGVCGAIHAAGGPAVATELARHETRGLKLAIVEAELVIDMHEPDPARAVRQKPAYRSSLDEAARVGAASVAFPAISTGIFGYPLEAATAVAVEAVRSWKGAGVDMVRFVCFDERTLSAYRSALSAT